MGSGLPAPLFYVANAEQAQTMLAQAQPQNDLLS